VALFHRDQTETSGKRLRRPRQTDANFLSYAESLLGKIQSGSDSVGYENEVREIYYETWLLSMKIQRVKLPEEN